MRASKPSHTRPVIWFTVAVLALAAAACHQPRTPPRDGRLHVDHVTLPPHKTWRVISVQPYAELQEIELVRVDWPSAESPHMAFTLSREGLKAGDAVCLDHIHEIDTFWAHPVPAAGCQALAGQPAAPAAP